jgi:hypothetical protein
MQRKLKRVHALLKSHISTPQQRSQYGDLTSLGGLHKAEKERSDTEQQFWKSL